MSLADAIGFVLGLAALALGFHLLPVGAVWLAALGTRPAAMPLAELRRATGLGADWRVRPAGAAAGAPMRHRCTGLYGLRDAARAVAASLAYTAAGTPGGFYGKVPGVPHCMGVGGGR